MHIAVVHNEVGEEGRTDEQDVLVQAEAILKALKELGHDACQLSCTLDLAGIKAQLESIKPDIVFNLVESLGGEERLIHLFPGLLDIMGIPYTGSHTEAIFLTTHKVLAKDRMSLADLPTPAWIGPYPFDLPAMYHNKHDLPFRETQWIIKSLRDHGSLGLDDSNIVSGKSQDQLNDILQKQASRLGGACFAEAFIHGREFNISIIGGPDGPAVLPPAEIIFEGFERGKPAIVGYKAKWEEDSHEYKNTPRTFDFKESDQPLLINLKSMALRCWNVFGLKGYARVDFRVDETGRPWILEINCNPCLNPDGGFPAAVMQSGLTYTGMIEKIINEAPLHKQAKASECGKPKVPGKQNAILQDIKIRYEAAPADAEAVRRLTEATGFFYPYEVDVAEELVLERLAKGDASGYYFVFAEQDGRLIGYTCYGPIACTASSFDFYWIAVNPDFQGKGLGRVLVDETERLVRSAQGKRIYVETSQRPLYDSTRAFYEKCGYVAESILEDFYGPGDGKVTYCKVLI
jgi:D-alanine-D-alanine ligase